MVDISSAARGEQGWPPLCLLKVLVLARWYDLSDVKLAEARGDLAHRKPLILRQPQYRSYVLHGHSPHLFASRHRLSQSNQDRQDALTQQALTNPSQTRTRVRELAESLSGISEIRKLVRRGLADRLFDSITAQLRQRHVSVKQGTLVDATIIASASKADGDARWVKHKNRKAVMATRPVLHRTKPPIWWR